jgi:hypothetical protein
MSRRLAREDGSALLTAVILISVMMMFGLAVHAATDTQTQQSGAERVRESALAVGEAALNAQVFQLNRRFPSRAENAYPAACVPGTATDGCPDGGDFQGYGDDDYATSCNGAAVQSWRTSVRDNANGAEQYYSSAIVDANPTWDSNDDNTMWVRAEGRAACRGRTMVTLVRAGIELIPFPRKVITANWFKTTNEGSKPIVDTQGTNATGTGARAAEPAGLSVRCDGWTEAECLGYDRTKGQVAPDTSSIEVGLTPLLEGEALEAVKDLAKTNRTYYGPLSPDGVCPPSLTGEVIYIEDNTSCPYYAGGNSSEKPGFVVINRGRFNLTANHVFYGVLYMRNEQRDTTTPVVSLEGTSLIQGAVHIDGTGGILAGSSGLNVIFDARTTELTLGLGAAVAVPNSWRELRRGE